MSDTIIDPEEFLGLSLNQYVLKLSKDLEKLGKNQSKEYSYLFVKDYKFGGRRTDLLLFVDVADRDWQENVPFIKAIATGKKVVDGRSIERDHIKYISNSIYGKCKLSKLADFDDDGDPDYALAVVTARGLSASKQKAVKSISESDLFEGEDFHVKLPNDYKEILRQSRLKEIMETEV